jgi:pyridoxamine 5'-phosphate oxidase family protein
MLPPFRPRGIEIRGPADAVDGPEPHIRIHPRPIVGWASMTDIKPGRDARDVPEKGDLDDSQTTHRRP